MIVSGFDPVRREIARLSLDKLIADGRIHPSRIEEVVKETQAEMDGVIRKKGTEAAQEVDVLGLKNPVIDLLGRLHFRTSYSQNVLRHSIEVAFISGMLAEMMGLDGQLAKRCGLLHDIGKAADHDMEGGHPKIGADLLKRHGEGEEVVHAALGHHDEILVEYPYTVVVATADACSASRPGARRESLDRYIKRMEELETIAKEFKGVRQAFAVQAGREVRVIASAKDADDAKAAKICRDIAKAFEERLVLSGRSQSRGDSRVTVYRIGSLESDVMTSCTRAITVNALPPVRTPSTRKNFTSVRILFIGDIVGKPGVEIVVRALPGLRRQESIDLVIANGENSDNGSGITPSIYRKLIAAGVDCVTLGDHIYRKKDIISILEGQDNIVKPANYPAEAPGKTWTVVKTENGREVAVFSLMGRVFMKPVDCPLHESRIRFSPRFRSTSKFGFAIFTPKPPATNS